MAAKKARKPINKKKPAGKSVQTLEFPKAGITIMLVTSIALVYLFLSNGAPYPPEEAIWSGALSAYTLPWGLVTYIFMHVGISHLLENLAGLAIFCFIAETVLSKKDALSIFFLSGIVGGIAFLITTPKMRLVGASAAIVGLATASVLADPKKGLVALVIAVLAVNYAMPFAADYISTQVNSNLEQQKAAAENTAKQYIEQNQTERAIVQEEVANRTAVEIAVQVEGKQREQQAGTADAAHVAGAIVGALYVLVFRRAKIYSWASKAKEFVAVK